MKMERIGEGGPCTGKEESTEFRGNECRRKGGGGGTDAVQVFPLASIELQ